MTKMNMVWIAVAKLLHSHSVRSVTESDIKRLVEGLFGAEITPVMINVHLVASEDRQADKANPWRGGSRNRYLSRASDGRFRLYKKSDELHDGFDKTGPTHPPVDSLPDEYKYLVSWYENEYFLS